MWKPRKVVRVKKVQCPVCDHAIEKAACPNEKCGASLRESVITTTKTDRNHNLILQYRTCKKCGERYCSEQKLYITGGHNPAITTKSLV